MAKGDVSQDRARERTTILIFLTAYGGFVAGTILIPISSTVGGIVFWLGVFGVFLGGWFSGKKK
ncbi:MAG: hypothetical protein ACE5K9_10740 [Candidatus Methylomirabilales bacterium]